MEDREIYRHKEWLGFLQPVGLVVSPPALIEAQAVINRNVIELQLTLWKPHPKPSYSPSPS